MNGYKREFTIHLIESSTATAPIPKLEFTTKATFTRAIFEKVLSDISVVSDQVTVHAVKDKLSFSGKSDIGKAAIELQKNDADVLDLKADADDKATYSIDYLLSISKALGGVVDTLQAEFSTKKPIRLEFKLNDRGRSSRISSLRELASNSALSLKNRIYCSLFGSFPFLFNLLISMKMASRRS